MNSRPLSSRLLALAGALTLCLGATAHAAAPTKKAKTPPAYPPLTAERKAALDQAIAKNRMGTLVIQTTPGARVRVEQLRHDFWFGAALSAGFFGKNADTEDAKKYRETFLANFNSGVTESAVKWHAMEPRRGEVNYSQVDNILHWADQHGIPLRGHNIFWGVPDKVQPWVKELNNDALRQTLQARALDIGRRYRGRFAEYDLNNEMIHGNLYEQRLGPDITRQMAQWVREGDPKAVLFVNDYDILTGRRVDDYVAHIRKLLGQGVPLGGIGAQGHSHGATFDRDALQHSLDKLGQLGLPVRVTEFNLPGQNSKWMKDKRAPRATPPPFTAADEALQARELADFYRICFAHPAVSGILMWGFWEGANWIPASALYRRDWSPRPAAQAYRDLVFKEWWTRWEGTADASGRCEVRAFYGKHRVSVGGREATIELKRGAPVPTVSLK